MAGGKFWSGNSKAAKITVHDVQQMRHDYDTGQATQGALAKRYKLSITQVARIVRGESWQNVPAIELGAFDLEASARRMLALQEEIQGQSARARMEEDARKEKEKGTVGDKLLNELTGGNNDGSRSNTGSESVGQLDGG